MANTSTIGTDARDYVSPTAWEAAIGAGTDEIGEAYKDSTFTDPVTLNNTNPSSMRLTVAVGERHNGTPGTGVETSENGNNSQFAVVGTTIGTTVEWWEMDKNGANTEVPVINIVNGAVATIQRCLIHGVAASRTNPPEGIFTSGGGTIANIFNNIIFDIKQTNTGGAVGILIFAGTASAHKVYNNTIVDIGSSNGAGTVTGILINDDADHEYKNNLVFTVTGGASAVDYSDSAPSNATTSNNLSEDATSPDAAFRSKSITFVNAGADDYHLAAGDADAIDDGADLGAGSWAIDIDGRNRDTEGDTWDIGAHELVAVGGSPSPRAGLQGPLFGPLAGPVG